MTAPPGEAGAGAGNGAEKKKFFPKKFGGVGMYFAGEVVGPRLRELVFFSPTKRREGDRLAPALVQ